MFQIAEAPIDSGFRAFGRGSFLGLPNIWWPMVALVLIVGFLLPRTRYGRRAIAVGGNRFAGAGARHLAAQDALRDLHCRGRAAPAIAGLLFAASSGPFTPASGTVYLLPVIAASILAGVSLGGGRGNIWLILLSVGFLSTVPTVAGLLRPQLRLAGDLPGRRS